MTIFIIVFVTLSIIGSALWVLPSKQDKQRMALRMFAIKRRVSVQLTSIELPDKWDKSKNVQKVCAYSLHRTSPLSSLSEKIWLLNYEVWKYHCVETGWWSNQDLILSDEDRKCLAQLQSSVTAIDITRGAVTLYWQEEGDEGTVDVIIRLLQSLLENPSIT